MKEITLFGRTILIMREEELTGLEAQAVIDFCEDVGDEAQRLGISHLKAMQKMLLDGYGVTSDKVRWRGKE